MNPQRDPRWMTVSRPRSRNQEAESEHLSLDSCRRNLLRKSIAILFRPVTIRRDWLHRRSTLSSTGARPFHLGFGHAEAGFRLQASTNVDDLVLFCKTAVGR